MKNKFTILLLAALFIATTFVRAQDGTNAMSPKLAALLKNLKYQSGTIDLKGGLATLTVPKEFNFLGSDDANTVLVKLWGNPPSENKPLGLLIPAGMTPVSSNCWIVTMDYSEDGLFSEGGLPHNFTSTVFASSEPRKLNSFGTVSVARPPFKSIVPD